MLNGKAGCDIFLFPATRKNSRLMAVFSANGRHFRGMLDNDTNKQGLMLDRVVILNPEIIPLCYGDFSRLFVIVSTSTRQTGHILADQLREYGLEEGEHFLCTG
jgi:hypothetical protein